MTQVVPPVITFRDRMRANWSPPWLATGNNERLLYAFGLVADIFGDAMTAAIAARFPNLTTAETLPIIGRERRIARGPFETDAAYAGRLVRWLDGHARRGNPYAMLQQIHAYYAPASNFVVQLLYRSGRHFVMAEDGAITRQLSPGFTPDQAPEQWARWWLIYVTDEYDIENLDAADIADISHVPREWNAGHCIGHIMLMQPGAELWAWPLGRTWNESGTWNVAGAVADITVD